MLDQYTRPLHARQHRDERHLHLVEQAQQPIATFRRQLLAHNAHQAQGTDGIGSGVGGGLLDRHLIHADLLLALAEQLPDLGHLDAEPVARQLF